jgi:hypothetical protein
MIIKRITTTIANSLWYLSCLPEWYAFQQALQDVAGIQRDVLATLLSRQTETAFGRRYHFDTIDSVAKFQGRVPLSTSPFSPPSPPSPPSPFSPFSPGVQSEALKPYTTSHNTEFQQAIAPWLVDLFSHYPALLTGQAYWSMTPGRQRNNYAAEGVPFGFEEDPEDLSDLHRYLLQTVMAVPSLVSFIEDIETFRYVTLLFLLRSRHLMSMSVWNPTFLTLLMARLRDWWPRLVIDINNGTLTPTTALSSELYPRLLALNLPDYQRAFEIRAIFQANQDLATMTMLLWPKLRLISCWADGHAKGYITDLKKIFPKVRLQGKGLMATEGLVSLPLVKKAGAALAIRSHFFEFVPVAGEVIRLAHQLEVGECYEVVITTGDGLYRYQLHDIVRIVGKLKDCPLLELVGKAAHISDWFGEKLNERQVKEILESLLTRHALRPAFAMLACDEQRGQYAYTLFIELDGVPERVLSRLGKDLEEALQESYHYRYCRELGQLETLQVFRIEKGGLETYLRVCLARGQPVGEIKLTLLHQGGGWSRAFRGRIL